jgi:ABC-type antimicrobial peptide transport system permease subunit
VRTALGAGRWRLARLLITETVLLSLVGAGVAIAASFWSVNRADSFQIDLQIEAMAAVGRIAVTGQVLDVGRPEIIGSGIEVTLSNRRGNVIHVSTNEFGEFHAEIPNSGDLELALRSGPGEPIVIALKDPLADLPGDEK